MIAVTQSAGSSSASGAGWNPGENGFLAATLDPVIAVDAVVTFAGLMPVTKLNVPAACTATNLLMYVSTLGVTLNGAKGCLFSSGGTLIAQTADQSAVWTSTGLKTMALTAESGQSLSLAAGEYRVGYVMNTQGTGCQFAAKTNALGAAVVNVGTASPNFRNGYFSATAPATLGGLGAQTSYAPVVWAALS